MRALALVATTLIASTTAQAPAPPAQPPAPQQRAWTILIYAAIDNDAEQDGNFFAFFDGVRAAFADDPGYEIVVFADRSDRYSANATSFGEDFTDARLYRVRTATACERLAGGDHFPEITRTGTYEPDSADPVNLRKALAFARAAFPAKHHALMLYGHADGRAMCPDEQSGHEIGFAQLTDAVPADLSVDLMALELCNMAGIEIAYQWRPGNGGFSTRQLVAIPNAGPPLDWARIFARLRTRGADGTLDPSQLDAAALGTLIVDEGGAGRRAAAERRPERAERLAHEAVSCLDLAHAAAVKQAVDALAVELARTDTKAVCADARGPGPAGFALNYVHDRVQRDPFVDLCDLAARLAADARLDEKTRAAAKAVGTAVDALVLASWGGSSLPRFTAGKNGVFVTFPIGDAPVDTRRGRISAWTACQWYTPLPTDGVWGRLAWCRDGATAGNGVVENWFELLDTWFDPPGEPGANGYTP